MDNLIVNELKNYVLTIKLNRIDKKNALTGAMYIELSHLLTEAKDNKNIRCVVIQGNQSCFTAGNDLNDFLHTDKNQELPAIQFIETLIKFPKPLIAAVAGYAVGIGTTLLLHCDYIVAAPDTLFKLPFTQLGLCPEAGSSYILPKLIGHAKAFELLVLGKSFTVNEALNMHLINAIESNEKLLEHIQDIAKTISALPVSSVLTSKALMKSNAHSSLPKASEKELTAFSRLLSSEECQQIINKFFISPN